MFGMRSKGDRRLPKGRERSLIASRGVRRAWWKRLIFWRPHNRRLTPDKIELTGQKKSFLTGILIRWGKTKFSGSRKEWTKPTWKRIRHHSSLLIRLLGIIAVLGSITFGSYELHQFLYTSQNFTIQKFIVSPTKYLTAEQIQKYTQVYLGQNLFRVDLKQLQRSIAARPEVEYIRVKRQLPNIVTIEIVEYEPVILVDLEGLYFVNMQGGIFKRALLPNDNTGMQFPRITGLNRFWYQTHAAQCQTFLRKAIALYQTYLSKSNESRPFIEEIRLVFSNEEKLGDFVLYTKDGMEIWIEAQDSQKSHTALEYFDVVWAALRKKQEHPSAILINNRAHPDWVVVRP